MRNSRDGKLKFSFPPYLPKVKVYWPSFFPQPGSIFKARLPFSLVLVVALLTFFSGSFSYAQNSDQSSKLDTIVISATRSDEKIRDLPIAPTIITQEEIERHPDYDLGKLLEEAGVIVDRQYPEGGMVVIRGMTGNLTGTDTQSDVLMLFNGHRIGTSNMLRFPSKNIERIEVIKGPAALQYGSSAMGGAVNVITKKGSGDLSAYVNAGVGSFGRLDGGLGLNGETSGFDYAFGYYAMHQNDPYETGRGEIFKGTAINLKSEVSLNAGYTFNDLHRLGLIFTHIDLNDYGFPGGIASTRPGAARPSSFASINGRTLLLDLTYDGKMESGPLSWSARYFYGHDNTSHYLTGYLNDMKGGQAQITGDFDSINTTVSLGFDWNNYDYESKISSSLKNFKYTDLGAYLIGTVKFVDDSLALTGGLRFNHYENKTDDQGGHTFSDSVLTPSLGLSYQTTDWLKFRTNYARAYRAPAAQELFAEGNAMIGRFSMMNPPFVATGVWVVPNFDLKPQEGESFELGADVEYRGFRASLTAFIAKYKNKIDREETQPPVFNTSMSTNPGQNRWAGRRVYFPNPAEPTTAYVSTAQYTNSDRAKTVGLEWDLSWDMGKTFDWSVSLIPYSRGTWLFKNEYTAGESAGKQIVKIPNYYISNGLRFSALEQGLLVDLNVLTKAKQRTSNLVSAMSSPEWQKGWSIANLLIKKEIVEWGPNRLSLVASINNIFDEYYEVSYDYPLPGRAFYLGAIYNFN
ncbi:MAG: TonB-dependent receptor [Deltaproteobacteria bacterium]|nr:TonB-dependent receptor [Deltaproteobacteria bacterium]